MNNQKAGHILVVDDEIEILSPLSDLLQNWGYEVESHTSARKALEVLKKQEFDVLLTDLAMPEIDGIELIQAALQIYPLIIGIVITGKGTIHTAVESMKVGAFDYLLKPLEWKILRPVLTRAMEVLRLRKAEEKYRSIVEDYQTEIICRFLPNGTFTFVNNACCLYFGKKKEELIGQSLMSFISEDDQASVKNHLSSLSPENPFITYEHTVRKPDGGVQWEKCTNHAIFDRQGNITEFQSVGHDITEQKRSEETLRKSEERYRKLVETMNEGLGVQDENGNVTYLNRGFYEILGHTRDEVIGKPIYDFLDEENRAIMEGQIARRKKGEKGSYEIQWTKKNGEKVYTLVSPEPIFDADGRYRGSSTVLTDITNLKEAEAKLKALGDQLRALAARLTEVEEAERKELARELHDQVGQNLTALGINLNMIKAQIPEDAPDLIRSRLDDSLALIEQTSERIRDVMSNLRPSVIDDYGLFAAIRWYCENFLQRTGIDISVQGEELIPRLPQSTETALFRIAQEALTNIVKHANASMVNVTLKALDGLVQLVIDDNGIGFDPARIHAAEQKPKWGVITMRERAEAIGGQMRVESGPGRGTRLLVEIRR